MNRRTCPVCALRYAGQVYHDCLVCAGAGTIELHPVAVHLHGTAVVARTIELTLTAAARDANTLPWPDRQAALAATVEQLRTARIIAPLEVPA